MRGQMTSNEHLDYIAALLDDRKCWRQH